MRFYTITSAALLLCVSTACAQPEPNNGQAALSINGTGELDASGTPQSLNSSTGPSTTVAPLYLHRSQSGSAIQVKVQSTAIGAPVILGLGPLAPVPLPLGAELLELSLPATVFVVDGTAPGLINSGATIAGNETWSLTLGQGLPPTFPVSTLQAGIVDPSSATGYRLTGTIGLDVGNDVETLNRNLVDAYHRAGEQPDYLLSLLSVGFLIDGAGGPDFLTEAIQSRPEVAAVQTFLGVDPATPTGAPAIGQTVPYYLELIEWPTPDPGCPSIIPAERFRVYDLMATEEGGSWKFHGTQRRAEYEVSLDMSPGPNQTIDVELDLEMFHGFAYRGGVQSVAVSGPQLLDPTAASACPGGSPTFVATVATFGCRQMWPSGFAFPTEEWNLPITLGSAGTSRMPYVEGNPNTAAPDIYSFAITWNDGTTSPPFTTPLRAALDPDADPAGTLMAIPGSLSGTLSNPGQPSATLMLTFNPGLIPDPNLRSALEITLSQGSLDFEFESLQIPADGMTQSTSLCVPGLLSGPTVDIEIRSVDIFGASYFDSWTMSF